MEGRGLAEGKRERIQPPALRATSFQRKEGEVVKAIYPLPMEGGCPKAKRTKPTSGATRHLLPEEGGRSGMSNHIPAFQWKERKIIFPVVEKEQNRSCHPIV